MYNTYYHYYYIKFLDISSFITIPHYLKTLTVAKGERNPNKQQRKYKMSISCIHRPSVVIAM